MTKRITIDTDLVAKLASIQCTDREIAAVLNVSETTLQRRCGALLKKGRDRGKASLRRRQWTAAMEGSIPMLIFLGKVLLGQREPPAAIDPDAPRPVFYLPELGSAPAPPHPDAAR